jgi:hypothetical protein
MRWIYCLFLFVSGSLEVKLEKVKERRGRAPGNGLTGEFVAVEILKSGSLSGFILSSR